MAGRLPPAVVAAVMERVPRHVIRHGECLVWTGALGGSGRPCIRIGHQIIYVARAVLAVKLGRLLRKKMLAAHTCDNPLCVLPDHLDEQSFTSNLRAAWARRRRRLRPSTLSEG